MKKQTKPSSSSKTKTKTRGFFYNRTPQEDSSPVKTTGLKDTQRKLATGTLETNNTPNITSYNKQKANHTKN